MSAAPTAPFTDERLAAAVATLPGWMERGGALRILLAAALALAAATLLPWQETLSTSLVVTGSSPPRSVRVGESGTLSQLRVGEGASVAAGDTIAVIGRDAYVAGVQAIADYAARAVRDLRLGRLPPPPPPATVGGEVQAAYDALATAVTSLRNDSRHDVGAIRVRDLQRSIAEMEKRHRIADEGIALRRSLADVAGERLRIQDEVARRGLISRDAMFARRQEMLVQRIDTNDAVGANQELGRQIGQARGELAALLRQRELQRITAFADAIRAAERVEGSIENRRRSTTLIAPVAGRVHFGREHDVGETLSANEEFAVVVPAGNRLRATGDVPASAHREVVVGATVRIESRAFPAALYGHLYGRVAAVSRVAVDGSYNILVDLPADARTSRGLVIPFRERTEVAGLITTRRVRVYEMLFGTVRAQVAGQ